MTTRPNEAAISGAAALAERTTTTTTAAARGECDDGREEVLRTETPDECALRATEESISKRAWEK